MFNIVKLYNKNTSFNNLRLNYKNYKFNKRKIICSII